MGCGRKHCVWFISGGFEEQKDYILLMCLKYHIKYGSNMLRYVSVIDFFPFNVCVVGPKGGMCKVENKSVRFGTTEPNIKYTVPAATQASLWPASPGMCFLRKTVFATEMLLTRGYLCSKVNAISMVKPYYIIKMKCLSNLWLFKATFEEMHQQIINGERNNQESSSKLNKIMEWSQGIIDYLGDWY